MNNDTVHKTFTFKKMDVSAIPLLLDVQAEAFSVMHNKNNLRENTPETLRRCFTPPSVVLGAYCGEEFVAFGILYCPGNDKENLANLLDESKTEDCYTTANLKLIIVRPKFRGLGLQRMLIKKLTNYAADIHFSRLCATVSPQNTPSLDNLRKEGFVFCKETTVYGGLKRYLMMKELIKAKEKIQKIIERQPLE